MEHYLYSEIKNQSDQSPIDNLNDISAEQGYLVLALACAFIGFIWYSIAKEILDSLKPKKR